MNDGERCAWLQQQVADRDRLMQIDRSIIEQRDRKIERLRAALADVATSSDGEQCCWCPESKPLTADHMPACRRARQALT